MHKIAALLAAVVAVSAAAGLAQAPGAEARYRGYVLGGSVASVVAASGAQDTATKTLQQRPALLQTFEWRAPYSPARLGPADPVHDIQFHFIDDALYRIDVRYDRERTRGLTPGDLVEAISATFGPAEPASGQKPATVRDIAGDMAVVARWPAPAASVTLLGGLDVPDYRLVMVSTALEARAATATLEANRLDALEAPQRAIDLRAKDRRAADAATAAARARNKPAFRP